MVSRSHQSSKLYLMDVDILGFPFSLILDEDLSDPGLSDSSWLSDYNGITSRLSRVTHRLARTRSSELHRCEDPIDPMYIDMVTMVWRLGYVRSMISREEPYGYLCAQACGLCSHLVVYLKSHVWSCLSTHTPRIFFGICTHRGPLFDFIRF